MTSPLLLKATEFIDQKQEISFWEDDFLESVCYIGGGFLGLTFVPIDALRTCVFTVRETFNKNS